MARKIGVTSLNASTIDILNTIRSNAGLQYQANVPVISKATEIPKVGEILYGYPALANEFINSLVNRIAAVRIKSATFNNRYKNLKKGYLEFGETVEEIYIKLARPRVFSPEKAASRELKRTLPDVRTAFHTMNWKVEYPLTIEREQLRLAFINSEGVFDLIEKLTQSVYEAAEYDEYLLFKYLLIKSISKGVMFPVEINSSNLTDTGAKFREFSNKFTFISNKYNYSKVETSTDKNNQYIFMDSAFNAAYDVNVLASAFNLGKAEFEGKLNLVDDWATFDNARFSDIIAESDGIEEVTEAELNLMKNVKAVLIDEEFFQVYDNTNVFTDTKVSSGLYWNYFYHVWKTVSYSPFSNCVVFVDSPTELTLPETFNAKILEKSTGDNATVLTINPEIPLSVANKSIEFIQTPELTTAGIAVHKYGAIIIPNSQVETNITIKLIIGEKLYTAQSSINGNSSVGDTIAFK